MKIKYLSYLLFGVMGWQAFSSHLNDDGDWQVWLLWGVSAPVSDTNWRFSIYGEQFYGEDTSKRWLQYTDYGVSRKLWKHHKLGIHYRKQLVRTKEDWKDEDRPHLDYTYSHPWASFKISNRMRMEFRKKNNQAMVYRFRNRATLSYPIALEEGKLSPYISEEIFMDDVEEKINQNRFFVGADYKKTGWSVGVYTMWRRYERADEWMSNYVLGLKARLSY